MEQKNPMHNSVLEQLLDECQAMIQHALGSGLNVPERIVEAISHKLDSESKEIDLKLLTRIHKTLADIVQPAKPRSILLMYEEQNKHKMYSFLGPIPLVRHLVLVATFCLLGLILLSLDPDVKGSFDMSSGHGTILLLNELFAVSAAGLGASFAALIKLNSYVVRGTFDPKYISSYWMRFILGIISGVILAAFIGMDPTINNAIGGAVGATTDASKNLITPLLAMLGGFSVDVVYRILTRLIETLESLVSGENSKAINAREQELKMELSQETLQNRMKLTNQMIELQKRVNTSTNPEEIKHELSQLLNSMDLGANVNDPFSEPVNGHASFSKN